MAAVYKIEIDQGSDVTLPLALKDSSQKAINLTGYAARMQIRPFVASPKIIDELTSENGRCAITADSGKLKFSFPHDQTELYPSGTLRYDIEIVSGDGKVTRILEGPFVVRPEVTR